MPKRARDFQKIIAKLTKPRRLSTNFPLNARTTMHTKVSGEASHTLTAGFKAIGTIRPGDITDPFTTIVMFDLTGNLEASLWEAGGHDTMEKIYKSYVVLGSKITIKLTDNTMPSTLFVDGDTTGASTSGTTTGVLLPNIWFCCIPTSDTADPAQNWHEIMNHPLLTKSLLRRNRIKKANTSITVSIPNHFQFMDALFRNARGELGQVTALTSFGTSPTDGQSPILHLYICAEASVDDVEATLCLFNYNLTQHVLCTKQTAEDTGFAVIMGDDAVPTVTG